MTEMRAALYDNYGAPGVLYEGRVPKPTPGAGEVLVRVHATSVNGGELTARAGLVKMVTGRGWPKRMGVDFAGTVEALGAGVTDLSVGDRVWGTMPRPPYFGSAAEFAVAPPEHMSLAPGNIELVDAAALPVVGITAITALRDKAGLARGERLLVRGASGGVGSVSVQLGHEYGAHVTALAGSANLDFVRSLGADDAYDYRTVDPQEIGHFDVVLDTVGTDLETWRRLLTKNGRMIAIAPDPKRMLTSISSIAISAIHGSRRVRLVRGRDKRDIFAELTRLTEKGAIQPVVGGVFPLSDISSAHRVLEAGGGRGKQVIKII